MIAWKPSVSSPLTICMVLIVAGLMLAVELSAQPGPSARQHAEVRRVTTRALPRMNGDHLKMRIVEVDYAPGASSPPHSHPCPVTVYVLSGAVRMQVKGGPLGVYKAGETFYEAPNGIHQVSANASQTKPAKFLAIFVCDHETPLTVPVPKPKTGEDR